jgi:hypothetical protein
LTIDTALGFHPDRPMNYVRKLGYVAGRNVIKSWRRRRNGGNDGNDGNGTKSAWKRRVQRPPGNGAFKQRLETTPTCMERALLPGAV